MSVPPCPWVYLGRLGKICQRFPESIEELMTASSSPATFSGKQLLDLERCWERVRSRYRPPRGAQRLRGAGVCREAHGVPRGQEVSSRSCAGRRALQSWITTC